jgi:multiple sugar transport system ATP-binding protein
MAQISLKGVSKLFPDGTQALHPTDLEIADGEFFIVVGPSGCGKSTLVSIIVGLTEPSTGEVLVDREPVTHRDPKDRNMAMVFQSYAIYPHMSVRENMSFPLMLAGLGAAEIAERVGRAAEMLELTALLDRRPAELSGGERQRVAMGRAVVREPAAFLLDEPLSNLDARLRVQMRAELARLQRRLGTTTVYVTHDQTEAMTLGHRIAVLCGGRVQQIGTPRELYERPANRFVAGFIGSPAMNFIPAHVDGERLRLPMLEIPLPQRFRGLREGRRRELVAGIRPEHLQQAAGDASPETNFSAKVEMVEWWGADFFVYVVPDRQPARVLDASRDADRNGEAAAQERLVARLGSSSEAAAGDRISLRLDIGKICLFDAATGESLDDCVG